jgi:hypothetical protein
MIASSALADPGSATVSYTTRTLHQRGLARSQIEATDFRCRFDETLGYVYVED